MGAEGGAVNLDITKILRILPHRSPFLLIDRIVELEPRKSARAIKCVTYNEPFFPGHFPGAPVFPAVLCIEAMTQLSACSRMPRTRSIRRSTCSCSPASKGQVPPPDHAWRSGGDRHPRAAAPLEHLEVRRHRDGRRRAVCGGGAARGDPGPRRPLNLKPAWSDPAAS